MTRDEWTRIKRNLGPRIDELLATGALFGLSVEHMVMAIQQHMQLSHDYQDIRLRMRNKVEQCFRIGVRNVVGDQYTVEDTPFNLLKNSSAVDDMVARIPAPTSEDVEKSWLVPGEDFPGSTTQGFHDYKVRCAKVLSDCTPYWHVRENSLSRAFVLMLKHPTVYKAGESVKGLSYNPSRIKPFLTDVQFHTEQTRQRDMDYAQQIQNMATNKTNNPRK